MTSADQLRALLARPGLLLMPGCHDALSAQQIERAGFPLAFMSGFAVSAARLGVPDTGLISYGEMVDQGRNLCGSVSIPIIGDGDTGFGNPLNVKRTVQGYAHAGFACVMIEDQVMPKRCGHTQGKAVVPREEALMRVRAAVDARDEGADILIMARTDARATDDLDEAIARCQAFSALGADITFLEAPESEAEMRRYCAEVHGPKMANLIEFGKTPVLPASQLEVIGYKIAVYPLTLLNVCIKAMREALTRLQHGQTADVLDFETLKAAVGFPNYYAGEARYQAGQSPMIKKEHTLHQRRAIPHVGPDTRPDWPRWELYTEARDEEPSPYWDVSYAPVLVETDLTPVVYGAGEIEWQDAQGNAMTTDEAEDQGRLHVYERLDNSA